MKMKNKIGAIELEHLGKLILAIILLLVLIGIVTVVIKGELSSQGDKVKDIFNFF